MRFGENVTDCLGVSPGSGASFMETGSQVQADREATAQAAIAANLAIQQQQAQERMKMIKYLAIGAVIILILKNK